MKIVSDENVFIIPLKENNKIVLVSSGFKKELIECLQTYFVSKKKTKCIVYDEEGNISKMDEICFIYLPNDISLDNNFEFKQKTIMNTEFSEFISKNPECFISIENIRNDMNGLLTDKGFYTLKKILCNGINKDINIEVNDFNISSLLQMLAIGDDSLTESEKTIMLLNLLIYKNRNNVNIIYIDREFNQEINNWIEKQNKNNYFIIDNEAIFSAPNNYDLMILSNKDHLIEHELENNEVKTLVYMNHEIVKENISLQNEKNVELFNQFNDQSSTFFIKTIIDNNQIVL